MNYCRVFTELAETFLEPMVTTPTQVCSSSECKELKTYYYFFTLKTRDYFQSGLEKAIPAALSFEETIGYC